MAENYRVFVHFEILDALPKSGKRRETVIRFLEVLGQIAHFGGDYEKIEPRTGRSVNVSEISGFAITWWIDAPAMEIKVIDVKPIGRTG